MNDDTYDFCLARYNGDGSLDTSFDGNGRVTNDFGFTYARAIAMAVQSDGKIVAVGACGLGDASHSFCLARYNGDGSLDASFDSDGSVTTAIGSFRSLATAVAVQSDGKIIVVGNCESPLPADCLARYNSDGSLDTSFDTDGKVMVSISGDGGFSDLALQSDAKVVVAGACGTLATRELCLARFNSNGSLDTSFDSDGKVTTAVSGYDLAAAVAMQSDGKIVIAGGCGTWQAARTFCLARYTSSGSLDTAFDGDGKVTTAISGDDAANAMAIQGDGKIVAAGACGVFQVGNYTFCLARYNSDGTLDTSFAGDGTVASDLDPGFDTAAAVALQGDGKIVAAGGCSGLFCLARYDGAGTTNRAPVGINDGYGVVQGSPSSFPATVGVLANDTDLDAGTTLTAVLVSGPTHGTLTLNANGSFTYAANVAFSGTDFFTYRASDGSLTSNVATVSIGVQTKTSFIDFLAQTTQITGGQQSALRDKLAKAEAFFTSGKLNAACDKLDSFIAQVNDLASGKLIPPVSAALINIANAVKTSYGCPA